MDELRPGLWRWTAVHPAWEPAEAETPGDWPREVGAVAYAATGALVLIDPLVTDDAWEPVDRLVEAHGRPVHVPVTIAFHERSREAAIERYGASETVPEGGDGPLRLCPESWLGYLRNGLTGEELRLLLSERLLHLPVELVLVSHGEPVREGAREALAVALEG